VYTTGQNANKLADSAAGAIEGMCVAIPTNVAVGDEVGQRVG